MYWLNFCVALSATTAETIAEGNVEYIVNSDFEILTEIRICFLDIQYF